MLRLAPSGARQWVLVGTLVAALLLLGVYDEAVLAFLTRLWLQVLAAAGLRAQAEALQQGINGGITKRFLPAVATYAVLYLSVCLLLLRVLLPTSHWRLALQIYAGLLVLYAGLVLLGKLAGDAVWAYRLGRHLLDFVVSPLPVAALYVLFRAGIGPAGPRG